MDPLRRAIEHHRAGRLREAAQAYVEHLRARPRDADALQLLGVTMSALGHPEDALQLLDRAVEADRRHGPAHANRGNVLLALGRPEDAAESLRRAVRVSPDLADAWAALGAAEIACGRGPAGVRALAEAVRLEPVRRRVIAFADALSPLADPPADLAPALQIALSMDGVDHSRLDRAVRAALAPLRDDPERLAAHPLVPPWLSRVVVSHPDWERALIRLRDHVAGEPPTAVAHALGRHAWANEHAWPGDPPDTDDPVVLAMYRDVHGLRDDLDGIPELTPDDPSSASVRAMYEESPYPRLVSVHLRDAVPLVLPGVALPQPLEVLVAGCGTGRHALQSAIGWTGARVLGIDLSRRSLARARALARQLGVTNLEVGRADLLRVAEIGRTFDVVEAVGVLHHLDDPLAGWRALLGVLRPGGVMRIGLYSERGRADVVAARALVASQGFEPTAEGLRAARQAFLALPDDHPARPIVWSPDFYSLSGFRDLVFHVREHRYTPARLRAELEALGLELVAFQHALPQVPGWYRSRWPDDERQIDLERWDEVERDHPRAFSGMYVVWCRPL